MTNSNSDEALAVTAASTFNLGGARAARALLTITGENREALREAVVHAGTVFANTSPGWRWADGIEHFVTRANNGMTVEEILAWYRQNR